MLQPQRNTSGACDNTTNPFSFRGSPSCNPLVRSPTSTLVPHTSRKVPRPCNKLFLSQLASLVTCSALCLSTQARQYPAREIVENYRPGQHEAVQPILQHFMLHISLLGCF